MVYCGRRPRDGTVLLLRDIQAYGFVVSIFFLDGNDATTRYGTESRKMAPIIVQRRGA
jgi:hypothetical protein